MLSFRCMISSVWCQWQETDAETEAFHTSFSTLNLEAPPDKAARPGSLLFEREELGSPEGRDERKRPR